MNLDFSELLSTVEYDGDFSILTNIWLGVFELATNDPDDVWMPRLNLALGQFRSQLDSRDKGAVLFGETAAHIFNANFNGVMDAAMSKVKDRFQNVDADARQAFNDYLGFAGVQGN